MTRVLFRVAFRVRVVGFESHINSYLFVSRDMLYLAFGFHGKLHIVAISTLHNAYALDLFGGKSGNTLLGIADETKPPNATPVSESDVPAVWLQLPTSLLVFNRAIIMLKPGIALLAWLLVLAVVIEPGDSEPGP